MSDRKRQSSLSAPVPAKEAIFFKTNPNLTRIVITTFFLVFIIYEIIGITNLVRYVDVCSYLPPMWTYALISLVLINFEFFLLIQIPVLLSLMVVETQRKRLEIFFSTKDVRHNGVQILLALSSLICGGAMLIYGYLTLYTELTGGICDELYSTGT
jgi:hypothetical protein